MIQVQDLSLRLMGDTIVEDLSFQVQAGEVVCLYGPSGCGKSTVLNVLADLQDFDAGWLHQGFSRLAYVFQSPRLLPWKTLWENIVLVADPALGSNLKPKAQALLQQLHLSPRDWQKYPHALSGGMCQRASLARALLHQPDLLLLDEAFSALDYELKQQLYALVQSRVQQGLAVVMISHDRVEALQLAHRIVLLTDKPARCRQIITLDTPFSQRDAAFIDDYLQQPYWQAHHV